MKDIFADLYDRVLSFFTSQTEQETKSIAKNRLKTVLMQDRVGFSERAMQMLKDDMLESISKYLEIEVDSFELSITPKENATVLNFSIPVLRAKTDEEIDEALSCQEQAKIEKTQEIVGELQELVKEKAQALADRMSAKEETEEESRAKEQNEEAENSPETDTAKEEEATEQVEKKSDKFGQKSSQSKK